MIYLKVGVVAVLFALLLALGLRGQDAPTAMRIEGFTLDAERNMVLWQIKRREAAPDSDEEMVDCVIELAAHRVRCGNQQETLTPLWTQDLEEDLARVLYHIGQVSQPAVWGERAGK